MFSGTCGLGSLSWVGLYEDFLLNGTLFWSSSFHEKHFIFQNILIKIKINYCCSTLHFERILKIVVTWGGWVLVNVQEGTQAWILSYTGSISWPWEGKCLMVCTTTSWAAKTAWNDLCLTKILLSRDFILIKILKNALLWLATLFWIKFLKILI